MAIGIRPVRRGDIIGMTRVVLASRGLHGQELELQIERDLTRFRQQNLTEYLESETLIAMDGSKMVGVMRYGDFDGDVHLTRPEVDPSADPEQVSEVFMREFWKYMNPQSKKAVYIDYAEPGNPMETLGPLLEKCGFEVLVERTDMRLQLVQPLAPTTTRLTFTSYDLQLHNRFLHVFKESFRGSLDPMMDWDAKHPEQSLVMFRERFGRLEPSTWVLATDVNTGRDIGFALFQHFQGGRYHDNTVLLYTAVLQEARGQGFGEEIVREGLRRVRQLRGPREHVSLTVSKPNSPAAKIYKKIGFQPVENFTVYKMMRS